MDFNSILIGSEDPERLVEYYTKVLGAPALLGRAATPAGSSAPAGSPSGRTPRSRARTPSPGRIIWNIETDDVQGDFDRMKAAGAIVIAEPYDFEAPDTSTRRTSIATFADPDDNYFQLMSPMGPPGS